jgi:ferredoxin
MADEGNPSLHEAVDVARSAVRAGAAEVHIASLESFDEMPVLRTSQGLEEFHEAQKEGIVFHPQRGPWRFLGKSGRFRAVEFRGVKRTYDEHGRFQPQFDDSLTEEFEADTVILAIGQQADLSFIRPGDGIELTQGGFIRIQPETLQTTAPGVFAGGDVAFGPRNIIDAVANGKQAAVSIDGYLRKQKPSLYHILSIDKIRTTRFTRPEDFEQLPRVAPPTIDIKRRTGISEVEDVLTEEAAILQAERCLACHIQTIYDAEKCVLCNRCVDICPEYCLQLVSVSSLGLEDTVASDLGGHYGLVDGAPASAMLKDDETCIRCGLCAIRCPTDAMTMELFYYEQREAVPTNQE